MNVEGTVVVVPTGPRGIATIRVDRSACGSCSGTAGCGLKGQDSDPVGLVSVATSESLSVGDPVVITLPDGQVVQAALLAYLLPLILAIASAFAAQWLAALAGLSESWQGASAPVGCLGGVLVGFALGGWSRSKLPVPQVYRSCRN